MTRWIWIVLVTTASIVGCQTWEPPDDEGTGACPNGTDEDGDGYGQDCPNGDDCDDSDASVNPGAEEICDGIDNDCDSMVDDADPDIPDADADGVGQCSDCNDADPDLYPGNLEVCDGVDNDCDGLIDDEDDDVADNDGDGAGACTDCDDGDPNNYPGNIEICDGVDNDCDGLIDDADDDMGDADGDGYGGCEDCDDENPLIHPGGIEQCNHLDDDCNGLVDDGLPTSDYYPDSDGDGYGDANAPPTADCMSVPGWTTDHSDCDDADAAVNPDAAEVCDGIDNDCDGSTDGADAVDASTWYADSDGDGYGDPGSTTTACDQPAGYTADSTDCDDTDPAQYPGALEFCNGEDDSCDGQVDENPVDGSWFPVDADGDGFGDGGSLEWACDGTDNDWDCDDTDPTEPVVVATTGSAGGAGTIDDPLASVQDGIDHSLDCVVVYGGTYWEAINFWGRDIHVRGVEGAEQTVIDATGTGSPVATFNNNEASSAVLQGFTLRGGYGYLSTSDFSYQCTSVTTCWEYYDTYCGGGVYASGASPTLTELILEDNLLPAASVVYSGNDTYYTYSYGGGLCLLNSDSVLTDVAVNDNFADQGGGAYIDEYSTVDWSMSWIISNDATDGGGIQLDGGNLALTNVASTWNDATSDGGGALVIDGALVEVNVTHGEDDAPSGAGLYLSGTSSGTVMNSIVYGADTGAGVLVDGSSWFSGSYNNVYGNAGGQYSGTSDPTGSNGNISADPMFDLVTPDGNDHNDLWTLQAGSPSIDAGDPGVGYNDADGTRNDQGAFGGPDSTWDS